MSKTRDRREKRRFSMRDRMAQQDSRFGPTTVKLPDGTKFWNPKKAGIYKFDILPFERKDGPDCQTEYWRHSNIGPDRVRLVCPKMTFGKPCPICEFRKKLSLDPDADKKVLEGLAPKWRQLWNILDHDDLESGVQIWDVSYHLFGKQLKARVNNSDEEEGYEYFADEEEGMSLKVGFAEDSFGGQPFLKAESIDFKRRTKPIEKEILDQVLFPDDLLIVMDYDKIHDLFHQGAGKDQKEEEEEDDEDDQEPQERPKQTKPKREVKEKKQTTADQAGLDKGDRVKYKGMVCEIVKISGDGTSLTLMDEEEDEMYKGVGVDEVELAEDEKEESKPTRGRKRNQKEPEDQDDDDDEKWDSKWDD